MRGAPAFDAVSLAPTERVPRRPFSDPEATVNGLGVLSAIRTAQRERLAEGHRGATWIDRTGATHWLVSDAVDAEVIELATTLFLDFDSTPPWRAVRAA